MNRFKKWLPIIIVITVFVAGCKKDETLNEEGNDASGEQIVPKYFLSGDEYEELVVEVQYVEGFQPASTAINNLKSFLNERLNKPGGITVTQNEIPSPGKSSYSVDEIKEIEENNRTQKTEDNTLTAYFLFLDGDYSGNEGSSKVLGIAYGSSSMVIFEKTIRDYSGGIGEPQTSKLETTVVNHEFGHILGLVNNGTALQSDHQDETHGKHCDVKECLMYYTAETSDVVGNLLGGNVPELDEYCIKDLKENGGK